MKDFRSFTKRFALPLWHWYTAGLLTLGATNYISIEIPQLAKKVVNLLASNGDLSSGKEIALGIIFLGFMLLVIRALSRLLIFWPGRKLEAQVKEDLFAKILTLPQAFFYKHGIGDLISRFANDVGHLRVFYAFGVLQAANLIYITVFALTKMFTIHQTLAAFCVLPLLLMIIISRLVMPLMHKYSKENQEALGRLTNKVTEAFVNVSIIQAANAEIAFVDRTEVENQSVYESNHKLILIRSIVFPFLFALPGLSQLIVLFYGGHQVISGFLSVGDILAFNFYIALLAWPLTAMGMVLAMAQRARASLERLDVIDSCEPEPILSGDTPVSDNEQPLLEINNLSFSFNSEETPTSQEVLNNINLKVYPKKRIGIYGKIGSGKSTLFNLIARLYDPPRGSISWNGKDILTIAPVIHRKNIGYALQSVHLFSESIKENLLFGLPETASNDELRTASIKAQILDDIENFTNSWETQIGEKGLRLSGGQKQRLALARLFLRNQPLLLLDDVLSAVDHATERRILEAIYETDSSLIISSHRGSALYDCDEILILDEGRIIDRGTYTQLLPRHPQLDSGDNEQ